MTPVTKALVRIIRIFVPLLALVPLAPLVFQIDINGAAAGGSLAMYFPYITSGASAFRIIVEVVFFSWLVLAVLYPQYRPNFRKPIVALMTVLTVISVLAAFFGIDPIRSIWSNFERMEGLVGWLHLYALFLVITTMFTNRNDWKPFILTFWSVSVLSALLALSVDDGKRIDTTVDGRAAGIVGNPIYLAIYMLMSAGFVGWWIASAATLGKKISSTMVACGSVSIALFGVAIALSGTRGTFVASAAALGMVACVLALYGKAMPVLRKWAIATLVAIAIFSGLLFVGREHQVVQSNRFLERASSVFNFEGGTIAARFNNWTIASQAIAERPILGWGQDNYIYPFTFFFNPKMANEEPWFDRTHNQFLDWFVHTGVVGGITYLTLIAFACFSIVRMREASLVERAALGAIVVGYIVHNMFVFDFLISAMLFVMILGYIAARSVQFGEEEDPHEKGASYAELEPVVVTISAILFIVCMYTIVIPATRGAIRMSHAVSSPYIEDKQSGFESIIRERKTGYTEAIEQFVVTAIQVAGTESLPEETRSEYVRAAVSVIESETRRVPASVRMLMFQGAIYSRIGRIDEAVALYERMAELAPRRSNNLNLLTDVYRTRNAEGDMEKAFVTAQQSFMLAPQNLDTRISLAKILIVTQQIEAADELMQGIDLYAEGKGSALFAAYQSINRYDKIAEILELYVADRPDDIELVYSLAAAHFEAGSPQKAIAVLTRLVASTTDAEIIANTQEIIKAIRAGKDPTQ